MTKTTETVQAFGFHFTTIPHSAIRRHCHIRSISDIGYLNLHLILCSATIFEQRRVVGREQRVYEEFAGLLAVMMDRLVVLTTKSHHFGC